jgi:hypothetical protein
VRRRRDAGPQVHRRFSVIHRRERARPRRSKKYERLTAVGLGVTSLLVVAWSMPRSVSAAVDPVSLSSSWTDSLNGQFENVWEPAMRTKTAHSVEIDNAISIGDQFAKEALVKGQRDFVVSGTRLTTADLARGKNKTADSFVSVPISAAGLVFAMRPSILTNGQWQQETPGPLDENGEETDPIVSPYDGPLNAPATLLADLVQSRLDFLANPRFTVANAGLRITEGHTPVDIIARSDPGALNVHLQHYFAVDATTQWNAIMKQYGQPAGYFGEFWAVNESPTRSLNSSLVVALADNKPPGNGTGNAEGGIVGVTTPGGLKSARERFPLSDFRALTIPNAAAKWVAPTPESITAGVLAGVKSTASGLTFTEDAALTDTTLTTAYPLTWVNWLLAPSTGLSIDKTNAIATLIRYVVSDGNAANSTVGDAALPPVLVTEALAKANALVASNCVGTDRRVVSTTDVGPFAPNATLKNVGTMSWCEAVVAPPPTTTAPPTTTTRAATTPTRTTTTPSTTSTTSTTTTTTTTQSEPATPSFPTQVPRATTPPPVTTTAVAAPPPTTVAPTPATTVPVAQNAAPQPDPVSLPFGDPQPQAPPFDRLTTMGLGGGGLFGAVRRWIRSGVR